MRHAHYDLIVKWAMNPRLEIECFDVFMKKWVTTDNPTWYEEAEYRIKQDVLDMEDNIVYLEGVADQKEIGHE